MRTDDDHPSEIVDDAAPLALVEVLRFTQIQQAFLIELVDAGVVSPLESEQRARVDEWRFSRRDLRRIQSAQRIMTDLQVNGCGAALILDLLDERDALLKRLSELRNFTERF